jgi:hypothetical protein
LLRSWSVRRPRSKCPGMQHVDGPADIETLPEPARARRPRVQMEAGGFVRRPERTAGIQGDGPRHRDVGEDSSVRSPEAQLAVRPAFDLIAVLVDGSMMAPTEQSQVRQCGRSSLGPVADVMALTEPHAATGEAAAIVAMMQCAS